ncbi:GIY-YIG nuclease family protein [Candidatus Gracilibacteria bacterium]|nr:GIY-YIG nuclease family protein [Candidatus Gracilibacteria bacterium]
MHYVYLLENGKGRIYIGSTHNLSQRLEKHNSNNYQNWTNGKGPWKLIYQEAFSEKILAIKREKYLKNLKAGQRIKKILNITSYSGVAQW